MSEEIVRIEREGDIGVICLVKPPVNAIGVALRTAVHDALTALLNDSAIKGILLFGEGKFFSAGADIKDFARASEKPTLPDVLKKVNNSPKPVVAALHGIAFGGALELALAAHLRVGIDGLRVALPEVKLGLLPGAGGTQRLTRLTGIAAAIPIICNGREVSATEAMELGIVSRLEAGAARDAGLRAVRDVLNGTLKASATDDLVVMPEPEVINAAREKFKNGLNAPLRALDAIEASRLPIDEGLAKERALFMELMHDPQHEGLVHAFFAERATSKIPEQGAVKRDVRHIGIVGGGTMGVGIATAFLLAGFSVTLIEMQADRVAAAQDAIEKNLAGALKRAKLNKESHAKALSALTCEAKLAELSKVDLVIEAIFEDMEAKTGLFKQLDEICKPKTVLATNTSYLDINQIAAATNRPKDVIGLHFFSPAHIMRLLEVVVADETAPEVVATCFELAKSMRKIPVRAGVCDGFIGNRILMQYRKVSEYLLLDGAEFDQIDNALQNFGFAMGPFAVGDLAGLDIARATRDRKAATRPPEERYCRVADLICDQGWFGRKTSQGYYRYEEGKPLGVNPGAQKIVDAERIAARIDTRNFSDSEIAERCLTAMMMEACKILEEGVALRPVDIDAVELFGYGFPRHRGGPMHMADQIGLKTVLSRIETYAKEDSFFWQVPKILREMIARKQSFSDLNEMTLKGCHT